MISRYVVVFAVAFLGTARPALPAQADASRLPGHYDIHLYFTEQAFLDEMTITLDSSGKLGGSMHVPKDFDAALENVQFDGKKFSLEIVVPKNSSRPKDFRARYSGEFFDDSLQNYVGCATILDSNDYMACFVGHRLPAPATPTR